MSLDSMYSMNLHWSHDSQPQIYEHTCENKTNRALISTQLYTLVASEALWKSEIPTWPFQLAQSDSANWIRLAWPLGLGCHCASAKSPDSALRFPLNGSFGIKALYPHTHGILISGDMATFTPGRRSHRKSRTGCLQCKKRKVKVREI